MSALDKATVDAFLLEMAALARKYRIQIVSCGCCDGATLNPIGDEEMGDEFAYHVDSNHAYMMWVKP